MRQNTAAPTAVARLVSSLSCRFPGRQEPPFQGILLHRADVHYHAEDPADEVTPLATNDFCEVQSPAIGILGDLFAAAEAV